jgi:hypothetical protein
MPFDFAHITSTNFGVCLDTDAGESYRLVPADVDVQAALREMLETTRAALTKEGTQIDEFSPAEKYGSNERLRVALNSDLVAKHRAIFAAENLPTDTHGLENPGALVSYFAVFHDNNQQKLMAFRRAAQFKGVVKKHLVTFVNDSLRLVPDSLFKLDADFDFLIFDDQILIWRPSGFLFTADMDEHVAACAAANVDHISQNVSCVDFTGLRAFVSTHKMGMRLVAAIKGRNDLLAITRTRLRSECKAAGVKVVLKDGKLLPAEGNEMSFLMLLDRRRYTVTLIPNTPETYEAPSRHSALRAE